MGLSNDYDTHDDEDANLGDAELSDEQYQWLQEQLAHIGQLRIEDEEESEGWTDPSGGLLLNMFEACETGDVPKLAASLADLAAAAAAADAAQQPSVDTPGPDGDTALHLACLYGHRGCVDALLAVGCRLDVVNSQDGTSALHDAAAGGYLELVKLLLSRGAGALVPLQDADGDTALHNAARGGHLEVVQCLLEHGAPPGTLNGAGKTAAGEAEEPAVVAALVAAAARAQQQQQSSSGAGGEGGGQAAAAAAAGGGEG